MERETPRRYPPREVARLLGIPPSTLRTYATEFASLLSADARASRAEGEGRARHRRYTEADLDILGQIKSLLEAGLSYEVARRQLGDRSSRSPGSDGRRRGGTAARNAARRSSLPKPLPIARSELPQTDPIENPAETSRAGESLVELIRAEFGRLSELIASQIPPLTELEARLNELIRLQEHPSARPARSDPGDRLEPRLERLTQIEAALTRLIAGESLRCDLSRVEEQLRRLEVIEARLARLEALMQSIGRNPTTPEHRSWLSRILRGG